MPAIVWCEKDVQQIGKKMGREISEFDSFLILKNVYKANNKINKALIVEEIQKYFV